MTRMGRLPSSDTDKWWRGGLADIPTVEASERQSGPGMALDGVGTRPAGYCAGPTCVPGRAKASVSLKRTKRRRAKYTCRIASVIEMGMHTGLSGLDWFLVGFGICTRASCGCFPAREDV